jgi:hypothetical protein
MSQEKNKRKTKTIFQRHTFTLIYLIIPLLISCAPKNNATPIQSETKSIKTQVATNAPILPSTDIPQEIMPTGDTPIIDESPSASIPTVTLDPADWQQLPIFPTQLSETALTIYNLGGFLGNNPQAFSKIGDCNSIYPDFLAWYEINPNTIRLGEYGYLQDTLDYFEGSWGHKSIAAKIGLTALSVMAPLWNDSEKCEANETPLDCEFRLNKPAFAIISFGTNDAQGSADFENSMRRVIENTIGNGVVPILTTKADNQEGDHSINLKIVELAYEYDIPLWNFWAAVQDLPNHGLETPSHLAYSEQISWVNYESWESMEYGWTVRNLSGTQLMDTIRQLILNQETN